MGAAIAFGTLYSLVPILVLGGIGFLIWRVASGGRAAFTFAGVLAAYFHLVCGVSLVVLLAGFTLLLTAAWASLFGAEFSYRPGPGAAPAPGPAVAKPAASAVAKAQAAASALPVAAAQVSSFLTAPPHTPGTFNQPQPPGGALGLAIAVIPFWAAFLWSTTRAARRPEPATPAPTIDQ
jgi:hypothetical protein